MTMVNSGLRRLNEVVTINVYFTLATKRQKSLAVSSSPWPWIDVFALPEKFIIAVTESGLDPKIRKMSITF